MTGLAVCPLCRRSALSKHCDSPNCPWVKCIARSCAAVFDLGARRGVVPDRGGWRWVRL